MALQVGDSGIGERKLQNVVARVMSHKPHDYGLSAIAGARHVIVVCDR